MWDCYTTQQRNYLLSKSRLACLIGTVYNYAEAQHSQMSSPTSSENISTKTQTVGVTGRSYILLKMNVRKCLLITEQFQ